MPKRAEHFYLHGKCKWARVDKPDLKFRKWSIVLYPDAASREELLKMKEKGIKNEIKHDEDGDYITLSRPMEKVYKGLARAFNPPEVLDGKNIGPDGRPLPLKKDTIIGNGSDVTAHVELYYYQNPFNKEEGCAIRLVSVRVNELVPFESSRDYNDEGQRATAGFEEHPAPLF